MTERYYPYIIVGGGLTGAPALWMKFDSSMPQVQYSLSIQSGFCNNSPNTFRPCQLENRRDHLNNKNE